MELLGDRDLLKCFTTNACQVYGLLCLSRASRSKAVRHARAGSPQVGRNAARRPLRHLSLPCVAVWVLDCCGFISQRDLASGAPPAKKLPAAVHQDLGNLECIFWEKSGKWLTLRKWRSNVLFNVATKRTTRVYFSHTTASDSPLIGVAMPSAADLTLDKKIIVYQGFSGARGAGFLRLSDTIAE
jgi:hypothetical protein